MSSRVTHLLDTSALLAYYLREAGWETVEEILFSPSATVAISSLSWLELANRLRILAADPYEQLETLQIYRNLIGPGIPADDEIADEAHRLKLMATSRLPNMDAMIAATARKCGAVLVHRDPHLAAIPSQDLPQIRLPDKSA
jgi:predicted nucleic acid-binding protein